MNALVENSSNKYFCIFGGGGIRGISYIGVLQALNELKIEITGCAGSSVGAVFATLLTLGYSKEEIKNIFYKINLDLFRDVNFNFNQGFAFSKGEVFLNWIRELIEKKFWGKAYNRSEHKPVCFKDLEKDLVILSVNLTDSKFNEFSRAKTPDVEIAYAIRASVSIPGLFKPVEFGLDYLVDGDLIKSWPLWRVSENLCPKDVRVLEFRLEDSQKDKKIDSGISYLNAVYNTITGFCTDFIIDLYAKKDKFDYIKINSKNIAVLDFTINEKVRDNLSDVGYRTTMDYFREFLPQKRVELFDNYYQIQLALVRLKYKLNKNQPEKSYTALCELFIHLCEHKRYIDILLYDEIINFKNLFMKNYEVKNIWFLSFPKFKNKNVVCSNLDNLISKITSKTSELKNSVG